MFIYLSKLVPLFVYPVGLVSILLAIATLQRSAPTRWRWATATALAILLLAGNRWTALGLARSLEWRFIAQEIPAHADAIVVLAGGTNAMLPPRQTVELNSAGDRLLFAAWLYHQGAAEHILLSGGRIDWWQPGTPPTEEMAVVLEMLGVPRQAMLFETQSRNTYENALYSEPILREEGYQRIILVTSASHMPRSAALFEQRGFTVIPAASDYTVTELDWQHLWQSSLATKLIYLVPSADNLSITTRMLKEYIGIFIYHLRGWL